MLTRLVRRLPGPDTGAVAVVTHDCGEQVHLLEGDLVGLTPGQAFGPGRDESRWPGMRHGPCRAPAGRTLLEAGPRLIGLRTPNGSGLPAPASVGQASAGEYVPVNSAVSVAAVVPVVP
ncbi:hypothetical protein ACFVAQ_44405 [Streptomyces sp. NPDC057651]|uniref:hypothetical protein n=1 Tax=Streptomyces sp. NPDC057651 TaxID=3346194 RepID=UPI0036CF92F2